MELTITKHHECSPQGKWMSHSQSRQGLLCMLLNRVCVRVLSVTSYLFETSLLYGAEMQRRLLLRLPCCDREMDE